MPLEQHGETTALATGWPRLGSQDLSLLYDEGQHHRSIWTVASSTRPHFESAHVAWAMVWLTPSLDSMERRGVGLAASQDLAYLGAAWKR